MLINDSHEVFEQNKKESASLCFLVLLKLPVLSKNLTPGNKTMFQRSDGAGQGEYHESCTMNLSVMRGFLRSNHCVLQLM